MLAVWFSMLSEELQNYFWHSSTVDLLVGLIKNFNFGFFKILLPFFNSKCS